MTRLCSVPSCGRPHFGKGYCKGHYTRLRVHGDVRADEPLHERQGYECSVAGCDKKPEAKGLCWEHYRRQRLYGDPVGGSRFRPTGNCAVDGCDRPAKRKKLCGAHYKRLLKHGDPLAGVATMHGEPVAFLRDMVGHQGEECVIWPYWKNPKGYGGVWFQGEQMAAARAMCIIAHSEPPTDLHEVAHRCGNGALACVNPNHLRWATRAENQDDRLLHGTSPRGENNGGHILTEEDVRLIRKLKGIVPQGRLAEVYGMSQSGISSAQRGKNWFWLDG